MKELQEYSKKKERKRESEGERQVGKERREIPLAAEVDMIGSFQVTREADLDVTSLGGEGEGRGEESKREGCDEVRGGFNRSLQRRERERKEAEETRNKDFKSKKDQGVRKREGGREREGGKGTCAW